MQEVLVVGELNVDILLNKIKGFPVTGQEILADEMTFTLGSSAAIFAANLASLGVATSFCGIVGDDAFGKFIIEELNKKKVATNLIGEVAKYQTGATIILNYGQDRANITHCGAMEYFQINDIPVAQLGQYRHLHLSSYFLQKGLQKDVITLFKIAQEKGLTTSLDIQWDPDNEWKFPYKDCLPYVTIFMPNEAELLALTGADQLSYALRALDAYSETIVVKRGIKGAVGYRKGNYTEAAPYLHTDFVDAIGAGDSFNAGFISNFIQGKSLQDCLMFGNLTGAVNTTAPGGTAAFSDRAAFSKTVKKLFNIEI